MLKKLLCTCLAVVTALNCHAAKKFYWDKSGSIADTPAGGHPVSPNIFNDPNQACKDYYRNRSYVAFVAAESEDPSNYPFFASILD